MSQRRYVVLDRDGIIQVLAAASGYGAQVAEQMAVTWDYVEDDLANAAAVIERLLNTDNRSDSGNIQT